MPHEFVLDALSVVPYRTNPMFGCLAVYRGARIVLILRDKAKADSDNGVWIATSREHHDSLRGEFPHMRSVRVFGREVTDWQVLATDAPDFEEAALRAVDLVVAGDPRIGRIPKPRRKRA